MARNTQIDWHFPRTDLAQKYLKSLAIGLMPSIVIFAPRKKGKTEFLQKDLLPAAEADGYRIIYCSMWENKENPLAALMAALMEAAKPRGFKERVGKALTKPYEMSLHVEVPLVGAAHIHPQHEAQNAASMLLNLSLLLDAVIRMSKGKVLLALDEVQHLAKPEFNNFVASLRTYLDIRKDSIKTIFTGSSRNKLQEMFSGIRAPLFQFSQTTDFPDLDASFVDAMSHSFFLATQRHLPQAETHKAFAATGNTPGLYREALLLLMESGGLDISLAVRHTIEKSRIDSGYAERFAAMSALDREVVHMVAEKRAKALYSEASLTAIAAKLGVDVSVRQVQTAIDRLLKDQLIYRLDNGVYEIEDSQLAEWIRHAPDLDQIWPEVSQSAQIARARNAP